MEETVLALQDEYGANVNILLWCFWLEHRDIPLRPATLERARAAIASWDAQVVSELRHLRRQLKALPHTDVLGRELRDHLKAAELLAERRCLELLESVELPAATKSTGAGENARVYLAGLGVGVDLAALNSATKEIRRR